jgi:hypothetical protein
MKAPVLHVFVSTIWLLAVLEAAADDFSPPVVVPVDKEPRHRLALQNEYVRVFDTRIAPGDTTLYHEHHRDSVYVLIAGCKSLADEELGKPLRRVSGTPGEVVFGEHSKKTRMHRFSNLSAEEHEVLDIELIDDSARATPSLGTLPANHRPILENARVRVSRIVLKSSDSFERDVNSRSVLVVLAATRLSTVDDSGAVQYSDVVAGEVYTDGDRRIRSIRNDADDAVDVIHVEIE